MVSDNVETVLSMQFECEHKSAHVVLERTILGMMTGQDTRVGYTPLFS